MSNPYESPKSKLENEFSSQSRGYAQSPLAWIVVAVVAVAAVLILVPSQRRIRWIGSYELTIILQPTEDISDTPPSFQLCASREEAAGYENSEPMPDWIFEQAKVKGERAFALLVSVSGTTTDAGEEISRYSPPWLVVQYETADGKIHRKAFRIPDGRGPRTMRVDVP